MATSIRSLRFRFAELTLLNLLLALMSMVTGAYAQQSGAAQRATPLPPPGAFGRLTPGNGGTVPYEGFPVLSWSASTDTEGYEYCVDQTNDSACTTQWISTGKATSVQLKGLDAGSSFSWHVRSTNISGTTYADGNSLTFWQFATPSHFKWLMDLDGNDSGDVFLYMPSTGAWWREFSTQIGFNEEPGSWSPGWSVLPGEFDGDIRSDMFLFNETTGQWFKMLNTGTGAFTTQASGTWWPGWQRHLIDLDGDGYTDVFLYDPATGAWFQCISTAGGFTYAQGGWNPGWEIHPMDLNFDRLGDLFLINRITGRWFWALGSAAGGFTYPVSETWWQGWSIYNGDFNADQREDFLLHDPATGTYFVAMTGASGFTYTQGGWSLGWTPYVADLNADGRKDLLLHAASTGKWFQMISDGAGNFSNAGGETWSLGWTLSVTDLNEDLRDDFLLYNPASGVWYKALTGPAPGTFTYLTGTWAPNLTVFAGYVRR